MKEWIQKLKGTKIPLPVAALGAIAMLILGSISNIVTDNFSQNKAAKIEAIKSFEEAAFDFEEIGNEYFLAKASKNPELIKEKKDVILKHVLNQVSAAEKLSSYINDDEAIDQYTDAMIRLRRAVMQDNPIEDAKPFWDAAEDVLVSRSEITNPKS